MLFDKFKTLSCWSLLMFSILEILFSCKSRTSKLLKHSTCFMTSIWFLLNIKTLKFSTVEKLAISFTLLHEISRKVKFGNETKFSILTISLFYKFKYFILSSPSNNGTCFKFLDSNYIFSTF